MSRVLAIVGLRLRTLARRMRAGAGAARAAGVLIVALLAAVVALGLAAALGGLTWAAVAGRDVRALRLALLASFYTFAVLGLLLPLMTGALGTGLDVRPLRIYPIGRGALYGLTLAASFAAGEHLLYLPAMAAVAVVAVLLPGVGVTAGLAVFVLVLLFIVSWGNALALFLTSLMRRRRVREVLAMVAVAGLVAVSVVPAFLEGEEGEIREDALPLFSAAGRVLGPAAAMLPPTLAARALVSMHVSGTAAALTPLLGLLLWGLTGAGLGYWIFTRRHLAEPGGAGSDGAAKPVAGLGRLLSLDRPVLSFLPEQLRAVASRELRYLLRSVTGKFILVIVPVVIPVLVFAFGRGLVGEEGFLGLSPESVHLFAIVLYTSLLGQGFMNNSFAWEGEGVQLYFTAPVSAGRVLAGKNLGVWLFEAALLAEALVVWTVMKGPPRLLTAVTAVLLYAVVVLTLTAAGNVLSVLFPVGRDMGSIRSSPSSIALLVSLLVLLVCLAVAGGLLVAPMALGIAWLQPVVVAILLAPAALLHRLSLGVAGRLMSARRELFTAAVRSRD